MYKKILMRAAGSIATLLCATLVLFIVVRMAPGDPVELMFWEHPRELAISNTDAYKEWISEMHAQYGLDRGIAVQYIQWL
jgi:peptide/nickel transport system permease protein